MVFDDLFYLYPLPEPSGLRTGERLSGVHLQGVEETPHLQ
jgi:hypothetical protein